MGFFNDLGAIVNDFKDVATEVTSTVGEAKSTATDTAQELVTEVVAAKEEIISVGQNLKTTVQEPIEGIKDSISLK